MTAVQNLDEFVFVLSPECPCDWGGLPGFGVTAAPTQYGPLPAVDVGILRPRPVVWGWDRLQNHWVAILRTS